MIAVVAYKGKDSFVMNRLIDSFSGIRAVDDSQHGDNSETYPN